MLEGAEGVGEDGRKLNLDWRSCAEYRDVKADEVVEQGYDRDFQNVRCRECLVGRIVEPADLCMARATRNEVRKVDDTEACRKEERLFCCNVEAIVDLYDGLVGRGGLVGHGEGEDAHGELVRELVEVGGNCAGEQC